MILLFLLLLCFSGTTTQAQQHVIWARSQQFRAVPSANPYTNDIIAYWTFDEINDDDLTYYDQTPNARDLLEVGRMGVAIGVFTNGVGVRGVGTYRATLADENILSPGPHSMTFLLWVQPQTTNLDSFYLTKYVNANGTREWMAGWESDTRATYFFSYATNAVTSTFIYAYTNWYSYTSLTDDNSLHRYNMLVCQIDTTNLVHRIRVCDPLNGISPWVTSAPWNGWGPTGSGTNTTAEVQFLNQASSVLSAYCHLDDSGIWARLLTDEEITNIWNNSVGLSYPFVPNPQRYEPTFYTNLAFYSSAQADDGTRIDATRVFRIIADNGTIGFADGLSAGANSWLWQNTNAANYLSMSDVDLFSILNSNSITLSFWVMPYQTNLTMALWVKDTVANGGRDWRCSIGTSGTFFFNYFTNAATSSAIEETGEQIVTNSWYYYVAQINPTNSNHRFRIGTTHSGAVLRPWVTSGTWNGYARGGAGTNTTSSITIGRTSSGTAGNQHWFAGRIDEVAWHDYILPEAEITNAFNAGAGRGLGTYTHP